MFFIKQGFESMAEAYFGRQLNNPNLPPAEPAKQKRSNQEMPKQLFALLGVKNEEQAIEVVKSLDSVLTEVREATGAETPAEALNIIRQRVASTSSTPNYSALDRIADAHDERIGRPRPKNNHGPGAKLSALERDVCDRLGIEPSRFMERRDFEAQQRETGLDPQVVNEHMGSETVAPQAHSTAPATGQLTEQEFEVCKQLGVEPSQFLERKKFEANQRASGQPYIAVNPGTPLA